MTGAVTAVPAATGTPLLHVGTDPRWVVLVLLVGPLVGAGNGLVAAALTLPLARRTGGWLSAGDPSTRGELVGRHLLVGTGLGTLQTALTGLAVVVLPTELLAGAAAIRPSLSWLLAGAVGTALLAGLVGLAQWPGDAAAERLQGPRCRVVAVYLLLLVGLVGLVADLTFTVVL